jgi:D-tyrosyl-tRNA(Tyr) deacylase
MGGRLPAVRALVQRVSRAAVRVGDEQVGTIGRGLCAFIGAGHGDCDSDAELLADRLCNLRVFEDEGGKMRA